MVTLQKPVIIIKYWQGRIGDFRELFTNFASHSIIEMGLSRNEYTDYFKQSQERFWPNYEAAVIVLPTNTNYKTNSWKRQLQPGSMLFVGRRCGKL